MTAVLPRCSHCNASGLDFLKVQRLSECVVVYCSNCGAVVGARPMLRPTSDTRPSQPIARVKPPAEPTPLIQPLPAPPVSQEDTPCCPKHNLRMEKKTIPPGHKDSGRQVWMCPKFRECKHWIQIQTVTPLVHDPLTEIGNADLSTKRPYSPAEIANRMRATGLNRGSHYLQIALDDGPPCCLQHKTEMVSLTIPPGFKNAGCVVWVCPDYPECRQWELAEVSAL